MRVLIACEKSGRVRDAFRAKGHAAFSVDLEEDENDSPYHAQDDVLNWLTGGPHPDAEPWDLMIAHPPCTYLCNSGVHWLHNKHKGPAYDFNGNETAEYRAEWRRVDERWMDLAAARALFMALWNAPIPKIVIENPVPHKYADLPPYTQTIQPYMFGDDASKRTCLWVKGLEPLLIPGEDQWVKPRIVNGLPRWGNQTDTGQNKLGPSETRAEERSRTYQGIADAFAINWG